MPKITHTSVLFSPDSERIWRVIEEAMRPDVYATMRGLEEGIETAITQAVFSCRTERERRTAMVMIHRRLLRGLAKARSELLPQ
jgi:hypothetical protein